MSPKPKLTIVLDTAIVVPGSTIAGSFVVDVYEKPFELTGAYVQVIGKEIYHVSVRSVNKRVVAPTHFTHVDMRRTVYGATKANTKKGTGVVLEPGHHDFPFSFVLPLDAPPTYAWDAYHFSSRIKYKLRGVLSVPHRQSVHTKLLLTVLPTVSFSQAQQAQAQPSAPCVQQVALMKNLGLSKSKSEYVSVELQVWPSVVVLAGQMADFYYQEQRQLAAGAHGQAVIVGRYLSIAEDSSDSDSANGDLNEVPLFAKKLEDDPDPVPQAEGSGQYTEEEAVSTVLTSDREYEADVSNALRGNVVRTYLNGEDKKTPLRRATDQSSATVTARIVIENHTKEPIKSFDVALRQARHLTVVTMVDEKDRVTMSTVTITLLGENGCPPEGRVAVDVELPIRKNMLYYLPRLEKFAAADRITRRQPLPTMSTANFSCENVVEVTFPKQSMNKAMGRFPGCVQVVEVVAAPGAPQVLVPASYRVKHEQFEEANTTGGFA